MKNCQNQPPKNLSKSGVPESGEKGLKMEIECGFAATNNGNHCVINGHCAVCKRKAGDNGEEN